MTDFAIAIVILFAVLWLALILVGLLGGQRTVPRTHDLREMEDGAE